MTALNTFIAQNLPVDIRQSRDFTGSRGWVYLMNQLLRRFEMEGLITLTQRREVGVEVHEDVWIDLPVDFRIAIGVYLPAIAVQHGYDARTFNYEIVNEKIKLREPYLKKESVSTFDLSSGDDEKVTIDDSSAEADQYNRHLLVLQDGTHVGEGIVLGKHNAASGGFTQLNFLHKRSTSISDSTSGYLTDVYLMLQYMATFTGLTAHTDEIPIDPKFDTALIAGLCYLAKPVDSKERKLYRDEYEYELDILKREEFTPSPDQARPIPRSMAAFEDCTDYIEKYGQFLGEFE